MAREEDSAGIEQGTIINSSKGGPALHWSGACRCACHAGINYLRCSVLLKDLCVLKNSVVLTCCTHKPTANKPMVKLNEPIRTCDTISDKPDANILTIAKA